MSSRSLAQCLLALAAVVCTAQAQTVSPAASAPPVAVADNPVDPQAVQALKDMGAYLQTLKRFSVEVDLTGERVLADGQKLQHSASAEMDVERPDRLRAKFRTVRTQRTLYVDGKNVTLYTHGPNMYASVPFSGTLADLTETLGTKYGIEIPMADMFLWGTPKAPLDKLDSAMFAGQDRVGGELTNHYAFRQGKLDWQIWIGAGKRPLPRKLVISNRSDDERPQSVSLIEWDLKPDFGRGVFSFRPPKGAKSIEMVPLKTK